MTEKEKKQFWKRIATAMWGSVALWVIIIFMQLFIGIFTIFFRGYGVFTLLIMVWNIVGCVRYIKMIKFVNKIDSSLEAIKAITYFRNSVRLCLVFACINAVAGGVVGAFGCLYDLIIAKYVLKHENELVILRQEYNVDEFYDDLGYVQKSSGEYKEEERKYF